VATALPRNRLLKKRRRGLALEGSMAMILGVPENQIKLDQFLKLANLVATGGEAKFRVQSGEVRVNGEVETRRGRKLQVGDVVEIADLTLTVSEDDFVQDDEF